MKKSDFIKFLQTKIFGKHYVLNTSNGFIHHYTCEWCDNISYPESLTKNKANELLKNPQYIKPKCCKNKTGDIG